MSARKKLRLVTDSEWAEIKKQREHSAFLLGIAKRRHEAEERDRARLAGPPPAGYAYHCKHCPHGTNCSDGVCVGCSLW